MSKIFDVRRLSARKCLMDKALGPRAVEDESRFRPFCFRRGAFNPSTGTMEPPEHAGLAIALSW